jgi:hypothetical protein
MQEENAGEVQEAIQPAVIEQPTVEETKQSDAEETQESKPEQEEQPRDEKGRFKPVQERINELTRQRHDAEREAAYWKAQASNSTQHAKEPSVEDFSDYSEYVKALTDYKADQKVNEVLSKRDQDQVSQAEAKVNEFKLQAWAERSQAVKAELKDFDDVLNASDTILPNYVIDGLLESEKGPQLAYHLAKNPDVVKQLWGMSQREADRELGRLETRLEKPKLVTKPVSNAPEPISSVRGSNAGNITGDPTKMSPAEFSAWAKKQGSKWI